MDKGAATAEGGTPAPRGVVNFNKCRIRGHVRLRSRDKIPHCLSVQSETIIFKYIIYYIIIFHAKKSEPKPQLRTYFVQYG